MNHNEDEFLMVMSKTLTAFIIMWFLALLMHDYSPIYFIGSMLSAMLIAAQIFVTVRGNRIVITEYEAVMDGLIKTNSNQNQPLFTHKNRRAVGRIGYVYLIQAASGHYKIGQTISMEERMRSLTSASPLTLTLVHSIRTREYVSLEKKLHSRFAKKRMHSEWFNLSDDDVAYIKSLGVSQEQKERP